VVGCTSIVASILSYLGRRLRRRKLRIVVCGVLVVKILEVSNFILLFGESDSDAFYDFLASVSSVNFCFDTV